MKVATELEDKMNTKVSQLDSGSMVLRDRLRDIDAKVNEGIGIANEILGQEPAKNAESIKPTSILDEISELTASINSKACYLVQRLQGIMARL